MFIEIDKGVHINSENITFIKEFDDSILFESGDKSNYYVPVGKNIAKKIKYLIILITNGFSVDGISHVDNDTLKTLFDTVDKMED